MSELLYKAATGAVYKLIKNRARSKTCAIFLNQSRNYKNKPQP